MSIGRVLKRLSLACIHRRLEDCGCERVRLDTEEWIVKRGLGFLEMQVLGNIGKIILTHIEGSCLFTLLLNEKRLSLGETEWGTPQFAITLIGPGV